MIFRAWYSAKRHKQLIKNCSKQTAFIGRHVLQFSNGRIATYAEDVENRKMLVTWTGLGNDRPTQQDDNIYIGSFDEEEMRVVRANRFSVGHNTELWTTKWFGKRQLA